MIFHVTATHRPQNCSAHRPERQKAFRELFSRAQGLGVKLHGNYVDAPGHAVYIVMEAEDAMAISRLLEPVLEFGHYEIRPVVDTVRLMNELVGSEEESRQ